MQDSIGYGNVIGQVPVLTVIALIVVVIGGVLLHLTRFGRYTFAIGSNEESARRVGVRVDRHLIKVVGFDAGPDQIKQLEAATSRPWSPRSPSTSASKASSRPWPPWTARRSPSRSRPSRYRHQGQHGRAGRQQVHSTSPTADPRVQSRPITSGGAALHRLPGFHRRWSPRTGTQSAYDEESTSCGQFSMTPHVVFP